MMQPPDLSLKFALSDRIPIRNKFVDCRDPVEVEESPISRLFFCPENVRIIINGFRAEVYRQSNGNYLVNEQDPSVLKRIMNDVSIAFQSVMMQQQSLTDQIKAMNLVTIEHCAKVIYAEAIARKKYLADIDINRVHMGRLPPPIMVSGSKHNQLEMKPWF